MLIAYCLWLSKFSITEQSAAQIRNNLIENKMALYLKSLFCLRTVKKDNFSDGKS